LKNGGVGERKKNKELVSHRAHRAHREMQDIFTHKGAGEREILFQLFLKVNNE